MIVFRPITLNDLDAIYQLALNAGIGITTLVKDKDKLKKRIEFSLESFAKTSGIPQNENYVFVIEDTDNNQVVGLSAIEASTGYETPFYSYKITRITKVCHELNIRSDYETLNLVNDHQEHTELCSLYLAPEYRKNKNGLLLSKARLLYMANKPERFSPTVIAEMRGVCDDKGISPFWENVGKHYFKMDFAKADTLTSLTNKQFIADLMPTTPIHICLLSQQAQQVIGQPHPSTVPAMKILQKEGFHFSGYVDIFDAGPTIEAKLEQIRTISNSRLVTINNLTDEVSSAPYFIANTNSEFRASMGNIMLNEESSSCIITHALAKALQVGRGDSVRISSIKLL